ncbi:TetR/AcrR family transcriptional regulator [Amycolatopsis sp. H20-H5]|uniref:TetR/AcrR family transcriptional regulator n=1 Tax=Amycolatopsis sp. H20-H5 TaxID=3046309 RepID=UPI002DBC00E7|nr:TetR/AcrR family transcriptional regulator [Amycolatopsis sp. H20-H5]MEC3975873.1 TetR/AcrR family transcriptional regulator [Amycolatopsis sp. H20-H5]
MALPRESETGRRSRISPEREAELYAAVVELLREVGYEAMTMDAVAARTRCGKATLYRQWRGKPQLVASALRQQKASVLDNVDTGSLRGDLHELVRRLSVDAVAITETLVALAHAIGGDRDLHQALLQSIVAPENELMTTVLGRAVARGEMPVNAPAAALLPQLMIGALVALPVTQGRVADLDYLTTFVDVIVLPALVAR